MEYSIIDFAFSLYAQKVTVIELVKQIVSMEFDADISVSFELRTNVYCLIFVNPSHYAYIRHSNYSVAFQG